MRFEQTICCLQVCNSTLLHSICKIKENPTKLANLDISVSATKQCYKPSCLR